MKKRIFSLLLAAALVLTFAPFAPIAAEAEAAELPHPITAENAGSYYCSHCKENVAWTAYTGQTGTGHYYLTENKTNLGQRTLTGNVQICLNMNGYNWTTTVNNRAFLLRNNVTDNTVTPTLSLMGAGTITANTNASTANAQGGLLYMHTEGGTFNLYDDVTLVGDDDTPIQYGGVVYMGNASKCFFNMYGGTISGGKVVTNTTWTSARGGSVYVNGIFNMYDGTISGGIGTGSAQGGCVNVVGGTFTMSGGTISGGNVANNGGNIHVTGGTFKMEGGLVTLGTSSIYGGNICVNGGTINVTGGTISNGTANIGGNVMTMGNKTHSFSDCLIIGGKATQGANFQHGTVGLASNGTWNNAGTLVMNHCVLLGTTEATTNIKGHNLSVGLGQTATLNDCYAKMQQTGADYTSNGNIYVVNGNQEHTTTVNLNNSAFPKNGSNNAGAGQNFKVEGANCKINIDGMTTIQQLFVNTSARPSIFFKKNFVGSVGIRNQQTVTVTTAAPAGITYENGYTGLGNVFQTGATNYMATYAPSEDSNTFYIAKSGATEYFGLGGQAALNFYHGYSGIGGGYVQRWFDTLQEAVDAYATIDCDYVFVRVGDSVEYVDSLNFKGSTYQDNTLTININGKTVENITMAEGSTLNLMNAANGGCVNAVSGGTVAPIFKFANNVTYLVAQDEAGIYYSGSLSLSTKAFLRTRTETVAFQGIISTKVPVAGTIEEIGIVLYKTNKTTGELEPLGDPIVFGPAYEFTAAALDDLHETGSYSAARVAIDSEGDNNNWWAHDITATTYVKVNGERYESAPRTVNYKESVEAMYNNADYHETVKEMIESTKHAGAYDNWNLVAPESTEA